MRTIIGIDPHKSSLTAVAVDDKGAVLGTRRVTVNKGTGTALLKWAAAFEDLLFAVEGAKGLGRSISQILVARNQAVVDVPATLSMKIRVLTTGGGHKTDRRMSGPWPWPPCTIKGLHRVAAEDQDSVLGLPPGWCGRPRHQGEGQRPDQSSSVTEEKPLGRGVTAPRCLPRCRLRRARLPRRLVLRVLPTSSGQEDDPVPKGLQPLTRGP
jgi:hypothetical protein